MTKLTHRLHIKAGKLADHYNSDILCVPVWGFGHTMCRVKIVKSVCEVGIRYDDMNSTNYSMFIKLSGMLL